MRNKSVELLGAGLISLLTISSAAMATLGGGGGGTCVDIVANESWPNAQDPYPELYEGQSCYSGCVTVPSGQMKDCVPGTTYRTCTGKLITAACSKRGTWQKNADGTWGCLHGVNGYFNAEVPTYEGQDRC